MSVPGATYAITESLNCLLFGPIFPNFRFRADTPSFVDWSIVKYRRLICKAVSIFNLQTSVTSSIATGSAAGVWHRTSYTV